MPVILDRSDETRWISIMTSPDEAFGILKPCPSAILRAHTIGNLINDRSANKNTPEVIRPIVRENNSLLF
jgi:putative SOS response-associated peptidase YedK